MVDIVRTLNRLVSGESLAEAESESTFEALLGGDLNDAQIGALLALIQRRGPTADELVGAARVMRRHVSPVPVGELDPGDRVIDTCGTGGAPKTFNVSTAAALVAAGAEPAPETGVRRVLVAKHGNRSRTGRGSAEVLAALGIGVDATPEVQARCLHESGVCFCFAIHHHPAMRFAAGPRKALGFPTMFNVLGPLTNPARAARQLIGVYDPSLVSLVAEALAALGAERALVVHGLDGLDELTLDGPSQCAEVVGSTVREFELDPASLGLTRTKAGELRAADVDDAARMIRDVLNGSAGPARDIVLLNAAAAVVVAGASPSFSDALDRCARSVDSGSARRVLDDLAASSNRA